MSAQHDTHGIHVNILLSHVIGMAKTKVHAILNARWPKTVSDIRSSLDIVNFGGYFIPNLATTAKLPLWKLAWNNVLFKWELEQIQAYEELRKQLAQPETSGYIDLSAQSE